MMFNAVIVETLLPDWPLLETGAREDVRRHTTIAVASAISRAPFHIRMALATLTIPLGLLVLLASIGAGGPAARAERADRLFRFLQRFSAAFGGAIRLYRSTTLLAFYEQPAVLRELLSDRPPAESRPQ